MQYHHDRSRECLYESFWIILPPYHLQCSRLMKWMSVVSSLATSGHSHWPFCHPQADGFHNQQMDGFSLFHHISVFPLCFFCPPTTLAQFTPGFKADSHSHFLLLTTPITCLFWAVVRAVPQLPLNPSQPLSTPQHILSFLIIFLPFLAESFLLPPLPPRHSSSPRGASESAEPQVRMFHRITQINVPSPPVQRQSSSVAPSQSIQSGDIVEDGSLFWFYGKDLQI